MKNKREKCIALCFLAAELCLGIWIIGNCFAVGRIVAAAKQMQTVSGGDAGAAAGEEVPSGSVSENGTGTISGNGADIVSGGVEGAGGEAPEVFSQTV